MHGYNSDKMLAWMESNSSAERKMDALVTAFLGERQYSYALWGSGGLDQAGGRIIPILHSDFELYPGEHIYVAGDAYCRHVDHGWRMLRICDIIYRAPALQEGDRIRLEHPEAGNKPGTIFSYGLRAEIRMNGVNRTFFIEMPAVLDKLEGGDSIRDGFVETILPPNPKEDKRYYKVQATAGRPFI